jgi:hypothetical protein
MARVASFAAAFHDSHLAGTSFDPRRSWHLQSVVSTLGCPGVNGPIPSAGLDELIDDKLPREPCQDSRLTDSHYRQKRHPESLCRKSITPIVLCRSMAPLLKSHSSLGVLTPRIVPPKHQPWSCMMSTKRRLEAL